MRIHNVNLSDLAASTIKNRLRDEDRSRNVKVEIEPGVFGRGDSRLLDIVLENLLDNA